MKYYALIADNTREPEGNSTIIICIDYDRSHLEFLQDIAKKISEKYQKASNGSSGAIRAWEKENDYSNRKAELISLRRDKLASYFSEALSLTDVEKIYYPKFGHLAWYDFNIRTEFFDNLSKEIGITPELLKFHESIFELTIYSKAIYFPLHFLKAINVGCDLNALFKILKPMIEEFNKENSKLFNFYSDKINLFDYKKCLNMHYIEESKIKDWKKFKSNLRKFTKEVLQIIKNFK